MMATFWEGDVPSFTADVGDSYPELIRLGTTFYLRSSLDTTIYYKIEVTELPFSIVKENLS
jgi:hypothetical protein